MFRLSTVIIFLVLAVALLGGAANAQAQTPPANLELGVFFPDPQLPDEQLPSVGDLHDFEASIGRQTDVFLWYESIGEDFYADAFRPMAQEGRAIQLAWEPHDFSLPANNQPAYRLKNITAGNFDTDIRRWARQLRDFGYPIYFRPMCEMNGDWVTWGGTVNGNVPSDYIPAWRHIHDIFVQEGATNVKWVWAPNRDGSNSEAQATFNTYYPGDAYVDYVGINGYNWGTLYNTPDWTSSWQSFEEVMRYSYDVAAANTSKPIVIAETATTEVGGNSQNGGKAQWISDALASLPTRFPRISMLTWFNINKETDWRVESSSGSLQAFGQGWRDLDEATSGCGIPDLTLGASASYWANFADYGSRTLTVDFVAGNSGTKTAYDLKVLDSANSNGVTTMTALPHAIGDLEGGGTAPLQLKYRIPHGVNVFVTDTHVTVSDSCGTVYDSEALQQHTS